MNTHKHHNARIENAKDCTYYIEFPSIIESIHELQPFLLTIKEYNSLDDNGKHTLQLILSECINNAIFHGNRCDPSLSVKLGIDFQNDSSILCIIEDQGIGFDRSKIANPTLPENLLSEGGRGVYLIETFSDSIEYVYGKETFTIKISITLPTNT